MPTEQILIPGDEDFGADDTEGPGVVLEQSPVREITETTLADSHLPKRQFREQVAEGQEDWGDGFFVQPEPVIVFRDNAGVIMKTVPLSEVPGVHVERGGLKPDKPPVEVAPVPTPVPLSTANREKLVTILANRLFKYYWNREPKDLRYNPFRDGIPELPAGAPEHFQPLPGTQLYPCTKAQVYAYCRSVVADRVTVINRNKMSGSVIQDISLRIQ